MLKFTVEQSDILKALMALTRINAKTSKDSLFSNILIKKYNDTTIEMVSTDMTTSIQYFVTATNVEGTGALYNGQMVLNIISRLSGIVNFDDTQIKCGRNKYKISTIETNKFPQLNFDCESEPIEYNCEDLKRAISETYYATSKLDGILSGIFFNDNEAVGCDSIRICITKINNCGNFILPRRLGEEITKLFTEENVNIQIDKNKVFIYDSKITLTSVLLFGDYPKYKQILPQNQEYIVNFKRNDLLNAINMLYPILDIKTPICKMIIEKDNMILKGSSIGNEGSTECNIDSNINETFDVGFNAQYLLDMLKYYDDDITMKITDSKFGGVVFEDNKEHYSMIMPIVVK